MKKEYETKDAAAKKKKDKKAAEQTGNGDFSAFAEMAITNEAVPANQILFVSNLPASAGGSAEDLGTLFSTHPGFKEVRLVPGRTDIAFVEFETDLQASTAKDSLNGRK